VNNYFRSVSCSRRSGGALLLVGVLAGVVVGGGVGVIAASSTKSVTVCADKTTNVLRYAKNGICVKTETKVLLNQTGAKGETGVTGAAGAKGETGVAGVKGDAGVAGAKGETGAAGVNGTNGTNGTPGTNGTNGVNGVNGTNGTNGGAGSSFSARSVCGSGGTTLCAVGVQGPGGGTVFYVDTEGKYSDFDYLEVAPADASGKVPWSTTTAKCGVVADTSCQSAFLTTSGEALNYLAIGTGRAATAAIVSRHGAGSVSTADYAAGIADAYTTSTASDWWLPSRDELNEVCKYARNTGQAAGANIQCYSGSGARRDGSWTQFYWSSSEAAASAAWFYDFSDGIPDSFFGKSSQYAGGYVRPVRGF